MSHLHEGKDLYADTFTEIAGVISRPKQYSVRVQKL